MKNVLQEELRKLTGMQDNGNSNFGEISSMNLYTNFRMGPSGIKNLLRASNSLTCNSLSRYKNPQSIPDRKPNMCSINAGNIYCSSC